MIDRLKVDKLVAAPGHRDGATGHEALNRQFFNSSIVYQSSMTRSSIFNS